MLAELIQDTEPCLKHNVLGGYGDFMATCWVKEFREHLEEEKRVSHNITGFRIARPPKGRTGRIEWSFDLAKVSSTSTTELDTKS
ncbi:unnamed protein product [Protopolystoma xenopodis]|uniref:Uncharacterized protein n=1 Tax=Protopolystoma xenopodis TaxID=117903 RepID=A0A3S5A775_9PLAT|nr:unnamed protein product [Protopolystoma xenopodis]